MNGDIHKYISEIAFSILPDKERDFYENKKSLFGKYSVFPDSINEKNYYKYCRMENGKLIPHGPTDEKWSMVPFAPFYSRSSTSYVLRYYLEKIFDNIENGEIEEGIKFLGVIAHYIEDSSHPAHTVNNRKVYQFLPPPEGKYWQLHRVLDSVFPKEKALREIKISLLGTNFEEVVFNLINKYEEMIVLSNSITASAIAEFYSGNEDKMENLINRCYVKAAEIIISLLHTVYSIANDNFSKEEINSLSVKKISEIFPLDFFTVDPYFFAPVINYDYDEKENLISLKLKDKDGNERTFEEGIATSYGYLMYEIPPGVYRKIVFKIGVSGAGKNNNAVFKVVFNGKTPSYAPFHTSLLDCGGEIVYESGEMNCDTPLKEVSLDIEKDVSKFTFIVDCPGEVKRVHAIWAEPVLIK